MHHVVLERWSQGGSVLHRRDPRAKTGALLVFLVVLATTHTHFLASASAYLLLLLAGLAAARLPTASALARAGVVLPFGLVFAAINWAAGEPARAALILGKSYLSALAVLILVSTTPLPQLLRGLEMLGTPRFLLMVAQFLYRYLFVISEEAQHMRVAAASRGGWRKRLGFRAAAGALAVLFARSYARAEAIHHSMLARGFQGHFQLPAVLRFTRADAAFLTIAILLPCAVRAALEWWA